VEIRHYKVQRISRRNGVSQFYLNIPPKFLRQNNFPEKVFVVVLEDMLIVTPKRESLTKILDFLIRGDDAWRGS